MTRKGKTVWLTRDAKGTTNTFTYKLYLYRPARSNHYNGICWLRYDNGFCPKLFERITGFYLNPGAGPVAVRIRVERVRK